MKGDFHIHTTYSDGALSVEEVLTQRKKLDFISITDHDFLQGSFDAVALGWEKPRVIVGFELSTEFLNESIHLLAYFPTIVGLEELNLHLQDQRKHRLQRAFLIKDRLQEHFQINLNMDFTKQIDSITRGTIADQIIKQGYPYSREEIFKRMIGRNCPAYLPSTKLSPSQGIALIHHYGGRAVLAHPTHLKTVSVETIIAMGLDGLEAIYSQNKPDEESKFRQLALDNQLFITAGSDFHRFNDEKHGDIGCVTLENDDLAIFLNKLGIRI